MDLVLEGGNRGSVVTSIKWNINISPTFQGSKLSNNSGEYGSGKVRVVKRPRARWQQVFWILNPQGEEASSRRSTAQEAQTLGSRTHNSVISLRLRWGAFVGRPRGETAADVLKLLLEVREPRGKSFRHVEQLHAIAKQGSRVFSQNSAFWFRTFESWRFQGAGSQQTF